MFSGVHLHYEIDTCEKAARLLMSTIPSGHPLNNFLVESYALNLRSLIDFLYWEPRRDDVNAIEFVKSKSEWLAARGAKPPPVLSEARTRADKQIVHLTKKRFADGAPEKNWKPGIEIAVLVDGLRLFLAHADPGRLHPVVAEAVARLATLVPPEVKEPSPGLSTSPPLETLSLPTKKGTDVSTTAPTRAFGDEPPRVIAAIYVNASLRAGSSRGWGNSVRLFAWLCVVVGLIVALGYPFYASSETERRYDAWVKRELESMDVARIRVVERLLHEQIATRQALRPLFLIIPVWPGVTAGACTTAFGILLLAILRRPKGANKDETR
jgi:hypothetical protein